MRIWTHLRRAAKVVIQGLSLLLVFPMAIMSGFGRFTLAFQGFGQLLALAPGRLGDYLRVAFYVLTLRQCSMHSRISFGTFFAHSSAVVGRSVYIGPYCVLGKCEIGARTQVAGHVQILSGRRQHQRTDDGRIQGANEKDFTHVVIGEDCWIGASSIVMADVGSGTTIGAGAVVTRVMPKNIVAVGNPARPR